MLSYTVCDALKCMWSEFFVFSFKIDLVKYMTAKFEMAGDKGKYFYKTSKLSHFALKN